MTEQPNEGQKSKSVDAETGEQIFVQSIDALSKLYGTKKIIATIYVEPETVEPNEDGEMPCLHLVTVGDPNINYDRYAGKLLSLQGQIWNNMQLAKARNQLAAEKKAREEAGADGEKSENENA